MQDNGTVKLVKRYPRLPGNLLFSFRLVARVYGADYAVPVDDPRWQALQRTIKVRDRLMHPKSPEDLKVTDEQMKDATDAASWFLNSAFRGLGQAISRKLGARPPLDAPSLP